MPNPLSVPITPPRVAFIDPRTGNVSREWYMFFLSLFQSTGGSSVSLDDLQKGPPQLTIDEVTVAINRAVGDLTPAPGTVELQAAIDAVRQELQLLPRQELGTMSQLQQDNVPWLQFDTTPSGYPTGALARGTLYWDDADRSKTLALVMEDTGNIIQDIGEETFYRVKASAAITKGQVVMFTGTVGASGGLLAAPATGLSSTQNEYIMGIATQDIALNGWGYVTWFGEVAKVNTTGGAEAWVDGQILYYNPAVTGGLTKNVPTAPNPKVIVASVVHAASNGILFVRPTFGSALGATDSNVEITGLANGDLLQYDSVQARWENVPASSLPVGSAAKVDTVTNATNATFYVTFVDADNLTSTAEFVYTDAGITYNPSTNTLTVTGLTVSNTINGSISGNAETVTNGVYTSGNQTIGGVKTFNGASGSFGTSTATGTINVATGATISGATKTVNIGTGGVSGSTTAINIGSSTSAMTILVDGATTFAIAGANIFSTVASGAYLRMAASTGGIQFNGDTAAANALDDYEEGSWTVQLYDASSGGNVSATTVTGYYTKIGNQVTCSFINLNNISTAGMTAGNQLYFTLPFTVGSTGSGIGACSTEVFAFGAGLTQINPIAEASQTRGRFMTTGTGVANSYLTVGAITTGVSDIERLTLTYFAA